MSTHLGTRESATASSRPYGLLIAAIAGALLLPLLGVGAMLTSLLPHLAAPAGILAGAAWAATTAVLLVRRMRR